MMRPSHSRRSEYRRRPARVGRRERRHANRPELRCRAGLELDERQGVLHRQVCVAGEEQLVRMTDAFLEPGRPGDRQRARSTRGVVGVHDVKGHAAEVIAVKVCQQDEIDRPGIEAPRAQRRERRRAAIHQERAALRLDERARVEPPAASECVAGTEEEDLHLGFPPARQRPTSRAAACTATVTAFASPRSRSAFVIASARVRFTTTPAAHPPRSPIAAHSVRTVEDSIS